MAREMADRRSHEAAGERVNEYEAYALKALDKGDDALARQCAEVVAAAEAERERYGHNLEATRRHIASLRAGIAKADARIAEIRREWLAARSRMALQRATGALAQSAARLPSALAAAEETLARITELQSDAADREAAAELLAARRTARRCATNSRKQASPSPRRIPPTPSSPA